jgi:hypothetical protein
MGDIASYDSQRLIVPSMSRHPRLDVSETFRHVMMRGVELCVIYAEDLDCAPAFARGVRPAVIPKMARHGATTSTRWLRLL